MKPIAGLMLFAASLVSGFAAEPRFEFTGVAAAAGKTTVALVDSATGASQWVEVGKTFRGYAVTAFDVKGETVTLLKDGTTLVLPLKAVSVTAAANQLGAKTESPALIAMRNEVAALRLRYRETHPRMQQALARLTELERQERAGAPAESAALAEARQELWLLQTKYQDGHPKVGEAKQRVAELERQEPGAKNGK